MGQVDEADDFVALHERVPPYSLDIERTVLGTALRSGEHAEQVVTETTEETFYLTVHRIIRGVIKDLVASNIPVDLIMIKQALVKKDMLVSIGGVEYLAAIEDVATFHDIGPYIKILRGYEIRRRVLLLSSELRERAFDDDFDADELVSLTQERSLSLEMVENISTFKSYSEIIPSAYEQAEAYQTGATSGLLTGIDSFDEITGGFHIGELSVICGRPGMGKTALAEVVAVNVAKKYGTVLFFSQEMSSTNLVLRNMCRSAGVSMHRLRSGRLGSSDYQNLAGVANEGDQMSLYISDASAVSPMQIVSMARRLRRMKNDLVMIIIDYIQLMSPPKKYRDNEVREMNEISMALNRMKKELNVAIVPLAQLNRNIEMRRDKHPTESDLKQSGQIEQDADAIIGVYRAEKYYPTKEEYKNIAEIGVLKQRNGPTEWVTVGYDKQLMKFQELGVDTQVRTVLA